MIEIIDNKYKNKQKIPQLPETPFAFLFNNRLFIVTEDTDNFGSMIISNINKGCSTRKSSYEILKYINNNDYILVDLKIKYN